MTTPLLALHAASDRVAFGAAGPRTADDLRADVAAVAAALPEPTANALALLAVQRDRYAFAAAVIGACSRGYTAAIADPDITRERFLQLAQSGAVQAVLHDTLSTAGLRIDRVLEQARGEVVPNQLARRAGAVMFLRPEHGCELEVAPIPFPELCDQALSVARKLELPERAVCVSTVQPQTRFGLLLGCLWPLLTGGECFRDDPRAGAWLSGLPDHATQTPARCVLVSVPAHVRAWVRAGGEPLARAGWLISGAAPLTEEAGAVLGRYAGLRVIDVCAHERTAELGLAHEPGAAHSPRSTALLEERVAWLPGVRDAAVLEAQRDDGGTDRYLAVVRSERAAMAGAEAALLGAIAERSDGVLFRRILLLDPESLPPPAATASFTGGTRGLARNGAGEHDRAGLLRLFDLDERAQPLSFELELCPSASEAGATGQIVFSADVPKNFGYFAGHFPNYPILPGAAQLSELVIPCVRRVRPELGRLSRMARLKFQERILPADRIEVVLTFAADPAQVDFSLRRGATVCAAGRLTFELDAGSRARMERPR